MFAINASGICFSDAARLVNDFSINALDDWYLPSTDELIVIRDERNLLTNNTPGTAYWSSTEDNAQNAFTVLVKDPENDLDLACIIHEATNDPW